MSREQDVITQDLRQQLLGSILKSKCMYMYESFLTFARVWSCDGMQLCTDLYVLTKLGAFISAEKAEEEYSAIHTRHTLHEHSPLSAGGWLAWANLSPCTLQHQM